MMEQTALDRMKLQQDHAKWEDSLKGYCRENRMEIGNLPSEVVKAWDDMTASYGDTQNSDDEVAHGAAQKHRSASEQLQKAWDKMTKR
ncbi:hypothetical protein [Thalassospira marina]|uniref:Uncharacterized protein n=1 Tax=Thalassospira marina TaxID=2048283 RepID=A0A2N3L0A8_9PROT|nr:hypothetical protein [Thalassospira marina]PKR56150.1 hypothetical protein COO20_02825 [Thalassospira marina]